MPLSPATETPADGSVGRAALSTALIQTKRVSTGSVAGGGNATITVTFDQAFPNANYTAAASVVNSAGDLRVRTILTNGKSTTQLQVTVENTDAINAASGTLEVIAIAD